MLTRARTRLAGSGMPWATRALGALIACGLAAGDAWASGGPVFGGDVSGLYRQRPGSVHLTSDQNIRDIHWSGWGQATVHGSGRIVYSAADRTPPARVTLALSHIRSCGKRRQYLWLSITYSSGKPRGETIKYTCHSPF